MTWLGCCLSHSQVFSSSKTTSLLVTIFFVNGLNNLYAFETSLTPRKTHFQPCHPVSFFLPLVHEHMLCIQRFWNDLPLASSLSKLLLVSYFEQKRLDFYSKHECSNLLLPAKMMLGHFLLLASFSPCWKWSYFFSLRHHFVVVHMQL